MTNPIILYGTLQRKQVAILAVEPEGFYEGDSEFKITYEGIKKNGYECTFSLGNQAYFFEKDKPQSLLTENLENLALTENLEKTENLENLAKELKIGIIVKEGLVLPIEEPLKGEPIEFRLLKGAMEYYNGNPIIDFVEN